MSSGAEAKSDDDKRKGWRRLTKDVVPRHYDLHITPDMRVDGTHQFKGHVSIVVDVSTGGNTITLNARELTIATAVLRQADGTSLDGTVTFNEVNETATIAFASAFAVGEATLDIVYVGELNDQLAGFYRSVYRTEDGRDTLIACTQFEATDARRALPCWDEPAVKATFTLTMVIPKGLTAVSNMPVVKEADSGDDCIEYTYDKSPIMSTYLLAFVVGEFDCIETHDRNGILIRVFAPRGKGEQGRFALDVAAKILPFYNEYFEIDYPLPKLDLLAIPDFSAGAMENWGCVTYREPALLVDPKNPSQVRMQRVAIVVAHELAHQWFGNLVTMEWWTHLWLNEGFATWIEYLAVDKFFPEWHIWTQFVDMDLGRSLRLDALESSHPIEVEVNHPDEVTEIFDVISYSKGSCAIRMLVEFLGQEPFRQGLCKYLKKFKYANAFTHDLWQSLSDHTGKPVSKVMDVWIKRTGYPVLTVTESDDKKSVNLSQRRFLSSGAALSDEDESLVWGIPIRVAVARKGDVPLKSEDEVVLLMEDKSMTVVMATCDDDDVEWLKFNKEQTGHYRVLYSNALLQRLLTAISKQDARLGQTERLAVQSDAFALTGAQLLPIEMLFEVISVYKYETSYPVWSDLTSNLGKLGRLLLATDAYDAFSAFAVGVYAQVGEYVGWEAKSDGGDEDPMVNMLRSVAVSALAHYGHGATVDEACRRFYEFCRLRTEGKHDEANTALAADLRGIAYRCAVKRDGEAGFNAVLDVYKTTDAQEEKMRALNSLGSTTDLALLTRLWDFTMSDDVRSGDVFVGLMPCLSNRHHGTVMWARMKECWADVLKRVGASFQTGRIISALSGYSSLELANDIETYFASNAAPAAERAIQQTVEAIRANDKWLKRDFAAIKAYLDKQ